MTTFVLSMFNANFVNSGGEPVVFGLAFAYGGLAQLLAGMWEFRTGNTFGALAFSSFGAFWLSLFVFEVFFAGSIPEGDVGHAAGLYLWAWAIFTTYMFVASLRTTGAIALVFILLAITFVLLAIGASGGHEDGHPLGRLSGSGNRGGGVVRVLRGGDQFDLRAYGIAREAVERVSGGV